MLQHRLSIAAIAAASACVIGSATERAHADLPPYSLVGSFSLPEGVGALDVLPDGRLVVVQGSGEVLVQSSVHSGTYQLLGSVGSAIFDGPFGNFGASFVSVSPDGTRLAIGDNGAFNRVHILELAALTPTGTTPTLPIDAPNYDGAWLDGSTLFVSGFGAGAGMWRVDVATQTATQVMHNSAGGAGGVAIHDGRVFVGDGFNSNDGGEPTGNVRAFDLAAFAGPSIAFESGVLVADALSASPVRFDNLGNMLVGGGDFFSGSNDFGYAAVIDAGAIVAAISGGPLAPDASELRLSPAGGFAYYNIEFNDGTGELLVFGDGIAYRFAVPAPGAAGVIILGGIAAARRGRR